LHGFALERGMIRPVPEAIEAGEDSEQGAEA
jgi:hypothetical protein